MVIEVGKRGITYNSDINLVKTIEKFGLVSGVGSEVTRVQTRLNATLSRYAKGSQPGIPFVSELPSESTIFDLMRAIKVPEGKISLVFVNGLHRSSDFQLKTGDEVSVFPLVGE
jgi:hypothetical protein